MFQINKLSVKYAETAETILEKLDLTIPNNSCIGIIGNNGSGKTTFALSIIGLIPNYQFGLVTGNFITSKHKENLFNQSLEERLNWISYVFQDVESQILFGTVADILGLNESNTAKDLIYQLLDVLEAKHLLNRNPAQISTGESQKIALLSALKNNPNLIIYDEATSALDPLMKARFSQVVKTLLANNKSIILFGQRFNSVAPNCSSNFVLVNKKLTENFNDTIIQNSPDYSVLFKNVSNTNHFDSININQISHHYKGDPDFTFSISNLTLLSGETIAIIGENGSGKTTFLNSLNGFFKPNNLNISIDDSSNTINLSKYIFTVFNSPSIQITEATIGKEFNFFAENKDSDFIKNVINHFPFLKPDKDPFELSFGQQRILCMLCSIASEKPILIFDEPELGIDDINLILFKEFIDWNKLKHKKLILYVTHDLELAKNYSDRLIMFSDGKIITDKKTSLISNVELLFEY